MFEYLYFILFVFFASASPGPDFVVVSRYSLLGLRRSALLVTMGIGVALVFHVIFCFLGVCLIAVFSTIA